MQIQQALKAQAVGTARAARRVINQELQPQGAAFGDLDPQTMQVAIPMEPEEWHPIVYSSFLYTKYIKIIDQASTTTSLWLRALLRVDDVPAW